MKYLIILPVINEEVTDNCVASMNETLKNHVLIIDNSKEGFAKKYGIKYYHYPQNLGVAKSWNIGARKVVIEKYDYLVIMSASVIFEDGGYQLIENMKNNLNEWGVETQEMWHLICFKRKTFETIGYFDENFYPAYYEDSDFIRRMELANIHMPMDEKHKIPKHTIPVKNQGFSHGIKRGFVSVNMSGCREYFIKKWGYEPRYDSQANRDKMYSHPFNNPELSLKYCVPVDVDELKVRYNV